jgi:hypothetical protein
MNMKRYLIALMALLAMGASAAQPFPLDYSYVGYHLSERQIPDVPVKVYVSHRDGDQSARIQQAIDAVARMSPDKRTGMRGAVLLAPGTYSLSRALRITTSGVVLRGTGTQATTLRKEGYDRGAVVYVEGRNDCRLTDTLTVSGPVALGASTLSVSGASIPQLRAGAEVAITRPSTKAWIDLMGAGNFGGGAELGYWGWHPGEIDVTWTRTVTAVQGNRVTLDSPLSMALGAADGAPSRVMRVTWPGRVSESGVENLCIEAAYDARYPEGEDHAWDGVYIANAKNCWVRRVAFRYLAGSAVVIQRSGSQVTVEDCVSREPVSEIGGSRRRTFLTFGERCLFQRLYAEEGINDFAAGMMAAGPNAFVQCESFNAHGFSGAVGPWATGLLYDCVDIDGNDIRLGNLKLEKYGTGWNTANSTAYQCSAAGIQADSLPDGSANYVYGCWAQFTGTGWFDEANNHVQPRSLFAHQLAQRLGRDVSALTRTLQRGSDAATSPTIAQAQELTVATRQPRVTMPMWIDSVPFVASVSAQGAIDIDRIYREPAAQRPLPAVQVENGLLVIDHALLTGGRQNSPWWNGRVRYSDFPKRTYALTRFVPGMEEYATTDRIDSVVNWMVQTHKLLFAQNYGLWYDRRRDDHERVRRRDGDVWPPFYEQAFARSGEGKAWDGLSRYDLNRLNGWYFGRLHEFAQAAAPHGMLLLNQHFFQHNILEAGAHWVDTPWRPANNINGTDFPEPVPFVGDKRVFMAERFYDVSKPEQRARYRYYIMQVLDALADCPNVIHSIGEEFTGPLAFVQFWLDTVKEWEQLHGRRVLVSLSVNKDVQDAILADAARREVVDIISIEQWYYHSKGLFAPPGGVNMAPRQYLRQEKVGQVSFADVYRAVSEYRRAYPDKAVAYFGQKYPELAWAILMAGGSCADVPVTDAAFLRDVATMHPEAPAEGCYVLSNAIGNAVVYVSEGGKPVLANLPSGSYRMSRIDAKTGRITPVAQRVASDEVGKYMTSSGVWWLQAK